MQIGGLLFRRVPRGGWALLDTTNGHILRWTLCDTRASCREIKKGMPPIFQPRFKVVKVEVKLSLLDGAQE